MGGMTMPEVLITGFIGIVYVGVFVGIGFGILKLVQIHAVLVRIEERLARRYEGREGG